MALPTKFGRFQIVDELGKGAMGIVYLATDPVIDRPVAIKTLSEEAKTDTDLVDRFTREARSAGILNHPNIITIYDVGEEGGTPFLALEYLKGHTLDEIITAGEKIPLEKRVEIICSAAKGLAHAHERGVVHRDIKPGNLFLTVEGVTKVTDFGIARSTSTEKTKPGVILGSIGYMAPEQIKGWTLDARIDIFALGTVAYELLTGQRAFPGDNIMEVMNQVLNVELVPVSKLNKEVPEELDAVVAKALKRDREERYQSALRFAEDLQSAILSWKRRTRGAGAELDEEIWAPISAEELFGEAEFDTEEKEKAPVEPRKIWTVAAIGVLGVVLLSGLLILGILYQRTQQRKRDLTFMALNMKNANAYIQEGNYQKALEEVKWILNKDPHNPEVLDLRKRVQRLVDRQMDVPVMMEKADIDYQLGNYELAKDLYKTILEEYDPANKEAKARLDEIVGVIEKGAKIESLLAEGNALYEQASFSKALVKWREVLELDPENQEALKNVHAVTKQLIGDADLDQLYERAKEAGVAKDYETQTELLKKIAQMIGDQTGGEKIRKEFDLAQSMLDRKRQINAWQKRADDSFKDGDYDQTIIMCNKILETDIANSRARELLKKAEDALRG